MDTHDTQTMSREEQIRASWNRARAERGLPPLPPGMRPYGLTKEDYEEDERMASEALRRGLNQLKDKDAQKAMETQVYKA